MEVVIKPAQELNDGEVSSMFKIMQESYHQSKMPQSFMDGINDADLKQLCAYILSNGEVIAACVVKNHTSQNDHPVSTEYPAVFFKHISVLERHRGKNAGTLIINSVVQEAFNYFNTPIIWSESAELGALKLYNKLGAWFLSSSIENANPKLSPTDNTSLIKAMMDVKKLNKWRLPNDVLFAWASDNNNAKQYLTTHGFSPNF